MRHFAVIALALASGCAADVCAGVDGTCLALTVEGVGQVDGLEITVSGAANGSKVVPPMATVHALPVGVAVQLQHASSGALHVDVTGVYFGDVVGHGSTDVTITAGGHSAATVRFGSSGGSADGGGGDGPTGPFTVTGTSARHYVLGDGGVVDQPADVGDGGIFALVETRGSFATFPGTTDATGGFTIPNVPSAPYYLRFRSLYVLTSSTHVDLGQWALGRPDQARPTASSTLALNVGNLTAWSSADTTELIAANAGSFVFGVESVISPAPSAGAVTLGGSLDLNGTVYGNLIAAGRGDEALVTQLVGDMSGAVPYQRLAKVAALPGFNLVNGGTASAIATFAAVAQNSSAPINWARSQFAQYRVQVNPQAADDFEFADVYAQPGGLSHGAFSAAPDVAFAQPATGTGDVTMSMTFGDPFPSSWPLATLTSSDFFVDYIAAGATAQAFDGVVAVYAAFDQLPSPIVPLVSPVRNPTINGQNAFIAQTGAGASPSIAWSAPALGVPSSYSVTVRAIVNASGKTRLDYVTSIFTRLTGVTIPPGVLQSGQSYFLTITAYSEAVDFDATPLQDTYPEGVADVLTAPFTP